MFIKLDSTDIDTLLDILREVSDQDDLEESEKTVWNKLKLIRQAQRLKHKENKLQPRPTGQPSRSQLDALSIQHPRTRRRLGQHFLS